jgi:nicotinamidase-related amidase
MPHPRIAQREDSFLLLVDLQEPLLKGVSEPETLVKNVGILIKAAKTLGLPIFATEQYPERFGPTAEAIRSLWGDLNAQGKMTFSCCGSAELRRRMEEAGRDTAIVCGVETHVCINQTVHDLLEQRLRVHVPADAVASRTERNHQLGLAKMRESGAIVTSVEMTVFELLARADSAEFKALLPLFK